MGDFITLSATKSGVHLEQVAHNDRVGHDDKGLGPKSQLVHASTVQEPVQIHRRMTKGLHGHAPASHDAAHACTCRHADSCLHLMACITDLYLSQEGVCMGVKQEAEIAHH